ncbi:MAG TPA: hypothetical protein PLP29_00105 [Candidatus Ozemobacteraceae bacterium]|nr:hypothetical protein [Candidatus Ozemobacteraceae bacterium]
MKHVWLWLALLCFVACPVLAADAGAALGGGQGRAPGDELNNASGMTFRVLNRTAGPVSAQVKLVLQGNLELATSNVTQIPPREIREIKVQTMGCPIPADTRFDLIWTAAKMKMRSTISGPADGSITSIAIGAPEEGRKGPREDELQGQTEAWGETEATFRIVNKSKQPIQAVVSVVGPDGAVLADEKNERTMTARSARDERPIAPGAFRNATVSAGSVSVFPANARFRCVITDARNGFLDRIEGSLAQGREIIYSDEGDARGQDNSESEKQGETSADFVLVNKSSMRPSRAMLWIGLPGLTSVDRNTGRLQGVVIAQAAEKALRLDGKEVSITLKSPGKPFPEDAIFGFFASFGGGKKGVGGESSELVMGRLNADSHRIVFGAVDDRSGPGEERQKLQELQEKGEGSFSKATFIIENKTREAFAYALQILGPDGAEIVSNSQSAEASSPLGRKLGRTDAGIRPNARETVRLESPDGYVFPSGATWRLVATGADKRCVSILKGILQAGPQMVTVTGQAEEARDQKPDSEKSGSKETSFTLVNRTRQRLTVHLSIGIEGMSSHEAGVRGASMMRGPVLAMATEQMTPGSTKSVTLRSLSVPFTDDCNFVCSSMIDKGERFVVSGNLERDSHTINIVDDEELRRPDGDAGRPLEGLENRVVFTVRNRLPFPIEAQMSIRRPDSSTLASEEQLQTGSRAGSKLGGKPGVKLDERAIAPQRERRIVLSDSRNRSFPADAMWRCVVSSQGAVRRIIEGSLARDSRVIDVSALDTPVGGPDRRKDPGLESRLETQVTLEFVSHLLVACQLEGGLMAGKARIGREVTVKLPARGTSRVTISVPEGIPSNAEYRFSGATALKRKLAVSGSIARDGLRVVIGQVGLR